MIPSEKGTRGIVSIHDKNGNLLYINSKLETLIYGPNTIPSQVSTITFRAAFNYKLNQKDTNYDIAQMLEATPDNVQEILDKGTFYMNNIKALK